jgi:hypothetical protein
MRRLMCTPHPNCSGKNIEKNEVGGACSTYGVEQRCIQGLLGKRERKRPLGNPRLDGRIILGWIFREWSARAWTAWMRLRRWPGGEHL